MIAIFVWHFPQARKSRNGAASLQGATGYVALAWAIILVILNLRLQIWLAIFRGVDLVELRRVMPALVVPLATLFLLLWVGVVVALTESQSFIAGHGKR